MPQFIAGNRSDPQVTDSPPLVPREISELCLDFSAWYEEDAFGTGDRCASNVLAHVWPGPDRAECDSMEQYERQKAKELWTLTHQLGLAKNPPAFGNLDHPANTFLLDPRVAHAVNKRALVFMPTLETCRAMQVWVESANRKWMRDLQSNPGAQRDLFADSHSGIFESARFELLATKTEVFHGALLHISIVSARASPPVGVWYLWSDGLYHDKPEDSPSAADSLQMPSFPMPPRMTVARPYEALQLNPLLIICKTQATLHPLVAANTRFPPTLASRLHSLQALGRALYFRPANAREIECPFDSSDVESHILDPTDITPDGRRVVRGPMGEPVLDFVGSSSEDEGADNPAVYTVAAFYSEDAPRPQLPVSEPEPIVLQGVSLPALERVPARDSITAQRGFPTYRETPQQQDEGTREEEADDEDDKDEPNGTYGNGNRRPHRPHTL